MRDLKFYAENLEQRASITDVTGWFTTRMETTLRTYGPDMQVGEIKYDKYLCYVTKITRTATTYYQLEVYREDNGAVIASGVGHIFELENA